MGAITNLSFPAAFMGVVCRRLGALVVCESKLDHDLQADMRSDAREWPVEACFVIL